MGCGTGTGTVTFETEWGQFTAGWINGQWAFSSGVANEFITHAPEISFSEKEAIELGLDEATK